jgi:hypothetical protein
MFSRALKLAVLLALTAVAAPAFAQSTTVDQTTVPFASGTGTELLIQSYPVSGGTLYIATERASGPQGPVLGVSQVFVPVASGGLVRYKALTDAKADNGVPLTATAGTPTGAVGVARTAGSALALVGETTSSSAKTDKALWDFDLPDTYVASANVPVTVNANYTGAGTITGASTTLTVAAYAEINGVETALTVTAAQQFTGAPANYVFTITGTSLTPGAHIAIEITMLVTSASGSNTGQINSVAIQG